MPPQVVDILTTLRASGRRMVLVNNVHQKSLTLKMEHTGLSGYFDETATSHDTGYPKGSAGFRDVLHSHINFNPVNTLLVDDSLPALNAAHTG